MGRIGEESEGYVSENLKLKESVGEDEKNEILRLNKGIKEKFPSIEKLCIGENFSPARAKPRRATEIGNAHPSIWILLFLPYPPCNSKLQLLAVPAGKEKCHVTLNDKTVVTVPHLAMAISDTSWSTLPDELSTISSYLQAVAV
nr:stress-response A/B barrel domain-containing protein UP3-like [Ipomoea batatas]